MKPASSTATLPISIPAAALIAAGLLFLNGCTTAPQPAPVETVPEVAPAPPPEPIPEPAPAPEVVPPPPPVAVTEAPPAEPATAEPVPQVSERLRIRIESNPTGAMIVVNGRPVGHAPVVFDVDSVNNGFFKEPVTIRARFLASDAAGESFSVDEELGQRERVPIALVFSRDGVQRVIRRY